MAEISRPTIKPRSAVAVPVRVLPKPTDRSFQPPVALPTPTASRPAAVRPSTINRHSKQSTRQQSPERRRRRMMWLLVGAATVLVLIGWVTVVRQELRLGGRNNLIAGLTSLFKTFGPSVRQATPAEQEIDRLRQQVFPQF